jgi:hypothetical protein
MPQHPNMHGPFLKTVKLINGEHNAGHTDHDTVTESLLTKSQLSDKHFSLIGQSGSASLKLICQMPQPPNMHGL